MTASADPKISTRLMFATYISGGVGVFLGFSTVFQDPPTVALASAIGVGLTGIISFVRHSIFNRSDAARMNWDMGRRNNFQIEVGLANLAWGCVAIASAALGWGLTADAAMLLTMGGYLLAVAAMQVFWPGESEGDRRGFGPLIGLGSFGLMLTVLGVVALSR